jgi:hypothetical protein
MKTFVRGLKIFWIVLFICLGYASCHASGEAGFLYLVIFIYLSFPTSVALMYLLRVACSVDIFSLGLSHVSTVIYLTAYFSSTGYLQWFILLPCIIKAVLWITRTVRHKTL